MEDNIFLVDIGFGLGVDDQPDSGREEGREDAEDDVRQGAHATGSPGPEQIDEGEGAEKKEGGFVAGKGDQDEEWYQSCQDPRAVGSVGEGEEDRSQGGGAEGEGGIPDKGLESEGDDCPEQGDLEGSPLPEFPLAGEFAQDQHTPEVGQEYKNPVQPWVDFLQKKRDRVGEAAPDAEETEIIAVTPVFQETGKVVVIGDGRAPNHDRPPDCQSGQAEKGVEGIGCGRGPG